MSKIIIDVREKDEFDAEHVAQSIHLPLSNFASQAPGILEQLKDEPLVLMCRSGKRAAMAGEQIKGLGFDLSCEVYKGGILEWKKLGNPTVTSKKTHLPIMRQVQIVAGSLVLLSVLAGFLIDFRFTVIAGVVGAGLTFAGVSGLCMMAEVLARLPWNKIDPNTKKELCEVSPKSTSCSK